MSLVQIRNANEHLHEQHRQGVEVNDTTSTSSGVPARLGLGTQYSSWTKDILSKSSGRFKRHMKWAMLGFGVGLLMNIGIATYLVLANAIWTPRKLTVYWDESHGILWTRQANLVGTRTVVCRIMSFGQGPDRSVDTWGISSMRFPKEVREQQLRECPDFDRIYEKLRSDLHVRDDRLGPSFQPDFGAELQDAWGFPFRCFFSQYGRSPYEEGDTIRSGLLIIEDMESRSDYLRGEVLVPTDFSAPWFVANSLVWMVAGIVSGYFCRLVCFSSGLAAKRPII